jgi:hypothetical protein
VRKLANFALFQGAWYASVEGAARGWIWFGPLCVALLLAVHALGLGLRWRELRYVALVGACGTLADSALGLLGATAYPSSQAAWPYPFAPPWISGLWIAFATLPRLSMAWLAPHPWWSALFGALGGPLSYYAGVRIGAVGVAEPPLYGYGVLALEYALATPLLLRLAPRGDLHAR